MQKSEDIEQKVRRPISMLYVRRNKRCPLYGPRLHFRTLQKKMMAADTEAYATIRRSPLLEASYLRDLRSMILVNHSEGVLQ